MVSAVVAVDAPVNALHVDVLGFSLSLQWQYDDTFAVYAQAGNFSCITIDALAFTGVQFFFARDAGNKISSFTVPTSVYDTDFVK
jgi:hypothetical protein